MSFSLDAKVTFKLGKNQASATVVEIGVAGDPERFRLRTAGGNEVVRSKKSITAAK
jgi:hypothetical protein